MMTALPALSLKSRPSLTFPRQTAKKTAPAAHCKLNTRSRGKRRLDRSSCVQTVCGSVIELCLELRSRCGEVCTAPWLGHWVLVPDDLLPDGAHAAAAVCLLPVLDAYLEHRINRAGLIAVAAAASNEAPR